MTKLKNDYLSNRFKEMMVKYNLMEYRKKIRKGEGVSITPSELRNIKENTDVKFFCENNMILKDDFKIITNDLIKQLSRKEEVIF